MNIGITTLRARWLTLGAAAILLVVALTAGTLFAANGRHQPEAQPQSSAVGRRRCGYWLRSPISRRPRAVPERVPAQQDGNDEEEEVDLPPIVKVPPQHPNLDANLNRLVEEAETGTQPGVGQQPVATNSAGGASAPAGEPVLVTFYIEPEQVAAVRQFLEDNDVFIRNVGEDWIEAHVPPALLGAPPPSSPVSGGWILSFLPNRKAWATWSARAWSCTRPTPGTAWDTGARVSRSAL